MPFFQSRLFLRIISKNPEVYILKIITLAIAFACTSLITLFSLNEFGYDRFHREANAVFRILERNESEMHNGNRLSNKIPAEIWNRLREMPKDSLIVSRVRIMNGVDIRANNQVSREQKIYAVDPEISDILTFKISNGSLQEFIDTERSAMISEAAALQYFGIADAADFTDSADLADRTLKVLVDDHTVLFKIAAVFENFPQNSHEDFAVLIRFDDESVRKLHFNPAEGGVYGRILKGDLKRVEDQINGTSRQQDLIYRLQSLPEIYFGPRVLGEEAKHGDQYSIIILVGIASLILFLALSNFINLTTLTLPYRAKELAIKKLAGTSQWDLILAFTRESFTITLIALVLGLSILLGFSGFLNSLLKVDFISQLIQGDRLLIIITAILFLIVGMAPVFMTFKFAKATPTRLLSTETISFPGFKRIITFLQLGISIFLIVASMVIKRQVNYSLVKEPGRNYDQIVYLNCPSDLTDESLAYMRATWKKFNPNIVDAMATSQLPDRINSKEIGSEFYFLSVDPGFRDFFNLNIVEGGWFKANDGDSIMVVNERARELLAGNSKNVIGVMKDINGIFNQPEKPVKIYNTRSVRYNLLCIRVLEVNIRRTVSGLSAGFGEPVLFMNKQFEEWLSYQDRLNVLSEILAIISAILSCCAIYGLSISLVRDKLKQIAVHKLYGATTVNITRILVREFVMQMILAIVIFAPVTYIFLKEWLRTFVYQTPFSWTDPLFPVLYCAIVIVMLCGFQARTLNRSDLTSALKG